jgi:hypothetical protein
LYCNDNLYFGLKYDDPNYKKYLDDEKIKRIWNSYSIEYDNKCEMIAGILGIEYCISWKKTVDYTHNYIRDLLVDEMKNN